MSKYIGNIDSFKSSIVFTYLQDISTLFETYKTGYGDKQKTIDTIARFMSYLKGFLFGLDVKHVSKYFYSQGKKYEYLSFYNNSARTVKYSLCLCLDPDEFGVKYTINQK